MTITITSPITERSAVETAATFDQTLPDYEHAVNIAMSRRGTRDAFIVQVCRDDNWGGVIDTFPLVRGATAEIRDNITSIIAAAHWITGSPGVAAGLVAGRADHRMMELIGKLVANDVPPNAWVGTMARVDPETCYAFTK